MARTQPVWRIDLEPVGRRVEVESDSTLLAASQAAGVELTAVCGGEGLCGKCRVRLATGDLSPPGEVEHDFLSETELAGGFRLACQAYPLSDVKIEIPPETLTAAQRLQIDGRESPTPADPGIAPLDIQLAPPTSDDLRADTTRLNAALTQAGVLSPTIGLPVLHNLSTQLRSQAWAARLALRGHEVVGVLPPGAALLGLAVDIGTTKLAAYLVDVASGETLAKVGAANPQIAYGEDVISRIVYSNAHAEGRHVLQARLVETLNELIAELCSQTGSRRDQIVEAVVVGNTVMHHLFAGLPAHQLGVSPYIAAVSNPLEIPSHDLGLRLAPGAYVYLPPNIAGYVGADHVAMLLAAQLRQAQGAAIALDIGTNTEISLATGGRLLTCSCASGPAFEGAHIRDGMRALPGAIEHVQIHNGVVFIQTVGGEPPVGICGSGILDAVAEMYKAEIVDHTGRLRRSAPGVLEGNGGGEFLLTPAASSGHGRDIVVTRRDVHEIQLAKGAIRAGIEILLQEAGLGYQEINSFIVAGAFGTYLDIHSAIRIGMFPPLPASRFHQIGNAAGIGAQQMLVSQARRREANEIVNDVEYIELTIHPAFTDTFMQHLMLG